MKSLLSLLLTATISLCPSLVSGQTTQSDQDEVVRFRSNEVRLDVVVTDKRGRPIKDLKPTDFEISEDGVPQTLESFRFVKRNADRSTSESKNDESKAGGATPLEVPPKRSSPGVTALVFDRLSPEARSLARKAGLAYAQQGMGSGDFTGVFGIDHTLRTVQSFTDNQELVRNAVERATGAATSTYASGAATIRDNAERSAALANQTSSLTAAAAAAGAAQDSAAASGAGAEAGQAFLAQKFLEMQNNMLDHYERLERDQEGFATINSLLAVISPMQNLPGRKTIIFFSEGLKLPPAVSAKFPSVINAANRANVSIYSIDAAGLRIHSGTAEAGRELNAIAAGSMATQARGSDGGGSGPYMRALERNEDLLRFDPRSGLGTLSDETGGFLIHNTNDLVTGLRRIDEDMHGYYFLTYVPQNKEYDGRFRRISVKVTRPNVEVQSRKGYYAVEFASDIPMLDYEAPAIAAARHWRSGSPQESLRSAALAYPMPGRDGLTLIVAEAPTAAFKFKTDSDNKSYSTDFSIVALVRDESERMVQKLSQHYTLTGSIQALDAAKKGNVLFYRETQILPGKYKVQVIAYDASTGATAVASTPLEVLPIDAMKPRLSSVAVLKRAERLSPGEQKSDQPFRFGELLVYPNLGERIDRSATKELAYFFTAWPAKGTTKPMQVTLEILQNKRPVGKTSGELPPADDKGQIKYASSFSLDKFPPGVFELKVTVSDGQSSVSRSTSFVLGP